VARVVCAKLSGLMVARKRRTVAAAGWWRAIMSASVASSRSAVPEPAMPCRTPGHPRATRAISAWPAAFTRERSAAVVVSATSIAAMYARAVLASGLSPEPQPAATHAVSTTHTTLSPLPLTRASLPAAGARSE
jgi:hypothetical protein